MRLYEHFAGAILVTIAASIAIVLAVPAAAQEPTTVRVSVLPIIDLTPLHVAERKGYFAEERLRVDTTPTSGAATGIPGLIAGSYDLTYGAPVSSLLALGRGLDVVVAAPGVQLTGEPETSVIVGRRDQSYSTAADLRGKTLAVNTRNSIVWLYARAWAQHRGADPDALTYREVPFPQMEDALRRGLVDAAFMVQPFKSAATRDANLVVVGNPFKEVQPGADGGHYMTTRQFADRNADVLQRFVRALRRGVAYYNENRTSPEIYGIVSDFTKIPRDVLKDVELPPMPAAVSVEQLVKTAALMRLHGMIETVPDVAGYVLPIALGR